MCVFVRKMIYFFKISILTLGKESRSMHLFLALMLTLLCGLCFGCAQRVNISKTHGKAYQQIFYQQGSAPPVQLAPTTSEDAKRISASRNSRSNSKSKKSSSRVFSLGNGSSSNGALE